MSGCIESKDWNPGSNEGKEKTSLDFCRTGISPGWFLSPPAMRWLSRSPLGTSSLLSVPSLLPEPSLAFPVGALHPLPHFFPGRAPPDLATELPAVGSFTNQEGTRGAAIPCPSLCYSFAKQLQAIQSPSFSRESRRRNRCNVRNQHLGLRTSVPLMTFVNNSRGVCIWET